MIIILLIHLLTNLKLHDMLLFLFVSARNVLSDSSATDTDPEEANNALASLGKKLPVAKRKALRHKASSKLKEKAHLKLKVSKSGVEKKAKKVKKKEKENIKTTKSRKVTHLYRLFTTSGNLLPRYTFYSLRVLVTMHTNIVLLMCVFC